MHFARYNPIRFAHLPTPFEPLPGLTERLARPGGGGPALWIKRDDCTGLAGGGNKTRKLEFLVGDALANDADTLITQGAVQSNHVRQTAAAAARFGMACEIIFESRTGSNAVDYNRSGNVLLDELLGASTRTVAAGTDMTRAMAEVAAEVAERGGRPYVIPGGGSNSIGALGYAECAMELVSQANEMGLEIDRIVTATGSAGTQAGLVAGLAVMGADIPVLGIGVNAPKDVQETRVYDLAVQTAALLGHQDRVTRDMVVADCGYVGAGYGLIDQAVIDALTTIARSDGILLDPVYTGKAMKGLIALSQAGEFDGETVVFLHTGGAPGLFGYQSELEGKL
ncbi:MAG: D-cysteine desulfhydrase [Phenylobacterium sp.]|uniref:D-cysteine desulfhydrase n=1 Tax=Phenylobacterium sp. TaxID=1871053 RepID=UPI0025DC2F5E|nr:D-cysteine desulfhydrase [Phenylobacterium sp.]MBI1200487.1 D-cysteine desulfhydrase [Phenylobacterium sp.]